MKCIKSKINGNRQRVRDEEARRLVEEGNWKYIPKEEYKKGKAKPE